MWCSLETPQNQSSLIASHYGSTPSWLSCLASSKRSTPLMVIDVTAGARPASVLFCCGLWRPDSRRRQPHLHPYDELADPAGESFPDTVTSETSLDCSSQSLHPSMTEKAFTILTALANGGDRAKDPQVICTVCDEIAEQPVLCDWCRQHVHSTCSQQSDNNSSAEDNQYLWCVVKN